LTQFSGSSECVLLFALWWILFLFFNVFKQQCLGEVTLRNFSRGLPLL